MAEFERLRRERKGSHIFLYAFDLLELDCSDLRVEPFEVRKATPAGVLRGCQPGLRFNEHLAHAGDLILCKKGLKASCRSASAHAIIPVERRTG
jgi:ATP-dependent DNA ligase